MLCAALHCLLPHQMCISISAAFKSSGCSIGTSVSSPYWHCCVILFEQIHVDNVDAKALKAVHTCQVAGHFYVIATHIYVYSSCICAV